MNNLCHLCHKPVYNVCSFCGLGTNSLLQNKRLYWAKCPNKHLYHFGCINNWVSYESYCVKCEEELIDTDTCLCIKS